MTIHPSLSTMAALLLAAGLEASATAALADESFSAGEKAFFAQYHIPPAGQRQYAKLKAGTGKAATGEGKDADTAGLPCQGWMLLLRGDFKDVGRFSCPDPASDATGASVNVSGDEKTGNTLWNVHGTAAAVYTSLPDLPYSHRPQLYERTFASYVTIDRAINSAVSKKANDSETYAAGGIFEMGFQHLLGGEQYFRLTGGYIRDDVAETDIANAALEWLPVYAHEAGNLWFYPQVAFALRPELVARFDLAAGDKKVVRFSGQQQSLRIGPEFALAFWGQSKSPLSGTNLKLAYDVNYETYSKKWLSWFSAKLSHNLDKGGNFALTAEYDYGTDPLVGADKNQWKVGLTGKY